MYNKTSEITTSLPSTNSSADEPNILLYVGVSVTVGVLVCILFVVCLLMHKKGKLQLRRKSVRHLFLRGFSTVSQRGVLDSTGEFEMVNTSATVSVSSDDAFTGALNNKKGKKVDRKSTPKKPDRRGRKSSSSASTNYENVTIDPAAGGLMVRKSPSMNSGIQYIDGTGTLDPKLTVEKDEDDDVFC